MNPATTQLPQLVIAATSGRALAQSARKSGREVVVLDAFGDRDTGAVAQCIDVADHTGAALDPERVLAALAERDHVRKPEIVVGSGFEHAPKQLERLRAFGRLYANGRDVVVAWKDPLLSTELFRSMGWDVPQTQRDRPGSLQGWLVKRVGGAGGGHIRRAAEIADNLETTGADSSGYYQREAEGRAMSVTFLADGEQAYVLGINQLRREAIGESPYWFAGAMTGMVLPLAVRITLVERLDRLVRITGLRGLCGFDFLLDGERVIALEINPRPTATFELYDDEIPEGLVHWHVRSFLGPVPRFADILATRSELTCRAMILFYADSSLIVPLDAAFPPWCRDLPQAGRRISRGEPVLSIFAAAESVERVRAELEARVRVMRQAIATWRSSEAAAGMTAISIA